MNSRGGSKDSPPVRSTSTTSPERGTPSSRDRIPIGRSRAKGVIEVVATLACAIVAILFAETSGFRQDITVLGATYALLALGMYVPFILGNDLSLAYNAYLGAGAYTVGIIATRTDVTSIVAIPIAMALSAMLAIVVGLATKRLSGFYLAGVTLLFGLAFETWLTDARGITGGSAGIPGIARPTIFGWTLNRTTLVVLAVLSVWLFGLLSSRLRRSAYGTALRGKREVPEAVEASGISVPALVLVSLAIGAAVASVGGSLFAMMNSQVLPESFTLSVVFLAVFMPLLGGRQSPWGSVIGAILVVAFTFGLQIFRGTGTLVFAVAVLLVLRLAPNGLLGLVGMVQSSYKGLSRRSS